MSRHNLIVAVTGASGQIYARSLFRKLRIIKGQTGQCGIIFSDNGRRVWDYEIGENPEKEIEWPVFKNDDMFAPVASGSAGYRTMIIVPCTMGTMGRIATGQSNDLICRAADVILKERGRLVMVLRELPYNLVHINNMKILTEAGAIICPASPSFYSKPATIEELVGTVTDRALELAGFEVETFRWK